MVLVNKEQQNKSQNFTSVKTLVLEIFCSSCSLEFVIVTIVKSWF